MHDSADPPTSTPPPPVPLRGEPPALDSFREAGWTITGSPAAWTATRIQGSASRIIAANSAADLLDKLIAADAAEPPEV